ncbi:hypothetical protein B0J18DRAFT_165887 [Chaetomium sp. MPI-SDFR-AT-0129]|nr:hypothetical protein B0J18DRAFT_165887 [Chaetomium sp. MPI-SDFR-AT-0129]
MKTCRYNGCVVVAEDEASLKEHVQSTHQPNPQEPQELVCNECGKVLSTHKSLKRHMNGHAHPNEFRCPFPECVELGYDRGDKLGNHIVSKQMQEICEAVPFYRRHQGVANMNQPINQVPAG